MRKAAVVLAAGLCVPVIGCCAEFWQTKDPNAWTEKELAKIRNKSPWARKEAQTQPTKMTTVTTTPAPTPPTKTTTAGTAQTVKTTHTTRTQTVQAPVGDVQFRWESAVPLLAATARIDPRLHKVLRQLAGDYYLVSLSGLALPDGYDSYIAINDMLASTSLHLGIKVVRPSRVSEMASGDGPFYLLQFSRDGTLEGYADRIEVHVHLGGTQARASFEPKQMVFQGRPAL